MYRLKIHMMLAQPLVLDYETREEAEEARRFVLATNPDANVEIIKAATPEEESSG